MSARSSLTAFLVLCLLSIACWGVVESPAQKAERLAWKNINDLYLEYIFANENERFLKAMMVAMRRVYDQNEPDEFTGDISLLRNQTEVRRQHLTGLVNQALRHTIAEVKGIDLPEGRDSESCMLHIMDEFSRAPALKESCDVYHWYREHGYVLGQLSAQDRDDSLEAVVADAVRSSFREYPGKPRDDQALAEQLGFVLLELQELFLRGKALRSLGHKVHKQMQNPAIAGDPAFVLYLQILTEHYRRHATLWHYQPEKRHYQHDLARLFIISANQRDYGKEWFYQVRRILDGQMPVPVQRKTRPPAHPPAPALPATQLTVASKTNEKKLLDEPVQGWGEWIESYSPYTQIFGLVGIPLVFIAVVCKIEAREQARIAAKQTRVKAVKKELAKALDKPGRKDRDGKNWKATNGDRKKVKKILTGNDDLFEDLFGRMRGRVLPPGFGCQMPLDDLMLQLQLNELYAEYRRDGSIVTEEDRQRDREARERQEREEAEVLARERREKERVERQARRRSPTPETPVASSSYDTSWGSSWETTYQWDFGRSDDWGGGSTSWDTSSTMDVQNRDASWD